MCDIEIVEMQNSPPPLLPSGRDSPWKNQKIHRPRDASEVSCLPLLHSHQQLRSIFRHQSHVHNFRRRRRIRSWTAAVKTSKTYLAGGRDKTTMPIQFSNVELIELPIIAGANHPSQRFLTVDFSDDDGVPEDPALDSACITLGWKAQSRTNIDFETFEKSRRTPTKKGKKGKLQRLSRAVKKRILRQNGVATSDIESEDERTYRKNQTKKKKKRIRIPGTKAVMKTFRSSQDRFSAQPRSDSSLGVPQRSRDDPIPKVPDSMPKVPQRCPISPMPTKKEFIVDLSPAPETMAEEVGLLRTGPRSPNVWRPNTPSTCLGSSPQSLTRLEPKSPEATLLSMEATKTKKKRTVKRKIKGAMVTLAKQPVKLAKQPVKLAKSTRKRFIKKVPAPILGDDEASNQQHDKPGREVLPSLPPLYVPGESSEDEDDLLQDVNDHDDLQEINFTPDVVSSKKMKAKRKDEQADEEPAPPSPVSPKRKSRRSSMEQVTSAISTLSKQPVKLAKQPVKLAKSTRKRLKKRRKAREAKLQAIQQSQRSLHPDASCSSDGSLDCHTAHSTRFLPSLDDIFLRDGHVIDPLEDDDDDFPVDVDKAHDRFAAVPPPLALSHTTKSEKKSHRSSLGYVANAIGAIAYQPVRVPVKLAKKTHKRLKRRKSKKKQKKEEERNEAAVSSDIDRKRSINTETSCEVIASDDEIEFVDENPLVNSWNFVLAEDALEIDGDECQHSTSISPVPVAPLTRRANPNTAYMVSFTGEVTYLL
jgi:hypothetical protein